MADLSPEMELNGKSHEMLQAKTTFSCCSWSNCCSAASNNRCQFAGTHPRIDAEGLDSTFNQFRHIPRALVERV